MNEDEANDEKNKEGNEPISSNSIQRQVFLLFPSTPKLLNN